MAVNRFRSLQAQKNAKKELKKLAKKYAATVYEQINLPYWMTKQAIALGLSTAKSFKQKGFWYTVGGVLFDVALFIAAKKIAKTAKGKLGGNINATPNAKALGAMKKMKNINPGMDCSEIAEDLFKASGKKGTIIDITPKSGKGTIKIPEGKSSKAYYYHQVYCDGKYVFDPRYSKKPILKSKYIKKVKGLNDEKLNVKKLK